MRHARLAALSVSAAGVMVLTAGCGGSGGASSGASSQASPKPTYTPPKVSTFAQFPGEELKQFRGYSPDVVGLRVKGIDAMWTPEFLGTSAQPGRHYLAVYVAVTSEASDRGSQHASLENLAIRRNAKCAKPAVIDTGKYCYGTTLLFSKLVGGIPDGQWRTHDWSKSELEPDSVAAGETRIGVAGFSLADDEKGSFELCAPDKKHQALGGYEYTYPCVPIPQPTNAR
ncbi:MAG TPA: hypothetical protein VGL93_05540 [Streptosporangiaceae bacterium]|jgi:hypothetical protein